MKPEFALILSHDGIGLAHRTRTGWARLGDVSLQAANMADDLAALRRRAQSLSPKGILAKLVIPASQILYTAIYAPGPSPTQRRAQIETALQGMTPYQVSDLVYDWSGTRQTVQVAVVARETLVEAEAFAQSHGFSPICFVAIPVEGDFTGEPWFGLSAGAANVLPEGAQVERDTMALPDFAQAAPEPAQAASPIAPAQEQTPQSTPEIAPTPLETAQDDGPSEATLAPPQDDTPPEVELASELAPAPEPEALVEIEAKAEVKLEDETAAEAPDEPVLPALAEARLDRPAPVEDTPAEAPPVAPAPTDMAASENSPEPDLSDPPEEISQEDLADLAALDRPAPPSQDVSEPTPEASTDPVGAPTPETASDTDATKIAAEVAQPAVKNLSSEAIAALAAVSAFSSTRAAKAKDAPAPDAPELGGAHARKLGGVGRLSPPQPERKKILTGTAGITAPGLDLPDPDPVPETPALKKTGANAFKKTVKKGLIGGAAIGSTALSATARAAKAGASSAAKAQAKPVDEVSDKTVFGAQKRPDIGGKPRYLGASLVVGLVLFLTIVGLWTSFLGNTNTPAPQDQIASAPEGAAPDVAPPRVAAAPEASAVPAPMPATPPAENAPSAPSVTSQVAPDTQSAPEAPVTNEAAPPEADTQTAAIAPLAPSSLPPFTATPLAPPSAPAVGSNVAPNPESAPSATASVTPTPEGVPMPGGFTLFSGKPNLVPGTRPESVTQAWRTTQPPAALRPEDTLAALPELAGFRPANRPASIAPPITPAAPASALPTTAPAPLPSGNDPTLAAARPVLRPAAISSKAQNTPAQPAAQDDGATLTPAPATAQDTRLAGLRPDARPASVQSAAKAVSQAPAAPPASNPFADASALAVATSARPPGKPRNFSRSVESALAAAIAAEPAPRQAAIAPAPKAVAAAPKPEEIDEPEPVKPAPKLPTSASVARQATEKNVINLRQINLIGLYGSSSNRRALVRLKNGRFIKVGVGDKLDGGQVSAIGTTQLTYKKGARSYTLKLLQDG